MRLWPLLVDCAHDVWLHVPHHGVDVAPVEAADGEGVVWDEGPCALILHSQGEQGLPSLGPVPITGSLYWTPGQTLIEQQALQSRSELSEQLSYLCGRSDHDLLHEGHLGHRCWQVVYGTG
jgi:hypothetical protein